jgi:hypothetical protein
LRFAYFAAYAVDMLKFYTTIGHVYSRQGAKELGKKDKLRA